jgi:hypothetical protein
MMRAALSCIRLSGGGMHRNCTVESALVFQSRLNEYMGRTFLTMQGVRTTGAYMFWAVQPQHFDVDNLAAFLRANHRICVDCDILTNTVFINPPATPHWEKIHGALETMADILDAPHYTGDVMLLQTRMQLNESDKVVDAIS